MKLIGSHTSPFVRKTRIVLAEKKIEYEFELDSPWSGETQVPNFNPLGKIPVLVLDDETPLFDSRVICDYLDNVAPNNKLVPTTNRERMETKRWEALSDGVCEAAGNIFLEKKRPEAQQNDEWIERQQLKIERGLQWMATELGDQAWCMGMHLTLADVACGCALGYLNFRFPQINWQQQHPNLARLYDKLMQKASFQESAPRD